MRAFRFAWRHRRGTATLTVSAAAGFAAFALAVRTNEGKKRHMGKMLSEMRRLPGRLRT